MFDPVTRFPTALYGLDSAGEVLRLLVLLAAIGLFLHFAARLVLDRSSLATALVAAVVGFLLAVLVAQLVRFQWLAVVLGLAAFTGVTALAYRVKWPKGAAIGALAWLLWSFLAFALDWLLARF